MISYTESVAQYVKERIIEMSKINYEPKIRATLAKLRRGVGKHPGEIPEIWEITLMKTYEKLQLPEILLPRAEFAIHVALCLFACHQQGKDIATECMHQSDKPDDKQKKYLLGKAVRRLLTDNNDNNKSIIRRFNVLATSSDIEEFAYHLRGMVQLLKAKSIPLDYYQLTKDIYEFMEPERRNQIRLRWGLDFYGGSKQDNIET